MKHTTNKELPVDLEALKRAALVFRAANHKLRQNLMRFIQKKNKVTVTEIYKILRLEQSVASQHLAILRRACFVNTQRDGKFIYYSLNQEKLRHADEITARMVSGLGSQNID